MRTNFTLSEDNTTEFKLSFQKEVIETVVAFSNTKDGHIYIGIADIFKTANIIEKCGSGVKRVIKLLKSMVQQSHYLKKDWVEW